MTKSIKNVNAVTSKLKLALTRTTNHKLEMAQKKQRKGEEMVERWKGEAMAAKCCKDKRGFSLSSGEEKNHESDTENDTDPDQAKDKYLLQL